MFEPSSSRRRRHALAALAVLAVPVWLAAQTTSSPDAEALRRDVLARFEVVPLRDGVALAGRGRDRRVEVVDGLVLAGGVPLSGADLRSRLGADAPLVLRLSYLDNTALRRLFGAVAAAPTPAVAAPPAGPEPVAQPPPAAPAPTTVSVPSATSRTYRRTGARISVGKSVTVADDEEVTDGVVVLGGNARIEGRVRDEIVVIGGSVELTATADVRGDITAMGGQVTIAPGASHSGAVHNATFHEWTGWSWPLLGWSWLDLGGGAPWLTLAGTLTRVALLAAAMGLMVLLAGGRVARVGSAAAASPLRAGAIGFGLQVLFVPALVVVSILMAITIVGLPFIAVVIPLALATFFIAMLIGFTGLAQALGGWIARRTGWSTDAAVAAAVLGLAVIVLPTVLSRALGVGPSFAQASAFGLLLVGTLVEYVAWTIGLGAAAMTGFGRYATVPPPLPSMTVQAPAAL